MNELTTDQSFLLKLSQGMGREVLQDVHKWLNQHMGVDEDKTYTLDEAVANLFQAQQFKEVITAIPTDIQCIDDWCGGGLRLGQLGLIMAPTGHGKSVCLILMAQKIASIQELPVWFVTNELTMEETTERFLARITGVKLGQIIKNPVNAMGDWVRYGKSQYDKNLWISEVNREVSMDELEAEMMRRANLYGTMPKVICLDFMERMKPNGKGYNRDSSWNWLGAIAQDIARFAKKHKILVWTAAQTNRSGLTSNTLDPGMIQGSIKHLQEATAMVSMNQLREVKDEIIMQFQALKMRQSARSNEPVYVKCDLSTMTITNETISRDEIIARGADDDKGGVWKWHIMLVKWRTGYSLMQRVYSQTVTMSSSSPAPSAGTKTTTLTSGKASGSVTGPPVNPCPQFAPWPSNGELGPRIQSLDTSVPTNHRLILHKRFFASPPPLTPLSFDKKAEWLPVIQKWLKESDDPDSLVQKTVLRGPSNTAPTLNALLYPCTPRELSLIMSVGPCGGDRVRLTTSGTTTLEVIISKTGFTIGQKLRHGLRLHWWKILSMLYGFGILFYVLLVLDRI
jgi:hypothetical protein